MVDKLEGDLLVSANKANTFENVSITRSNTVVSTLTDLLICITPRNPVPPSAKLTIVYPEDQAILSGQ